MHGPWRLASRRFSDGAGFGRRHMNASKLIFALLSKTV